MAFKNVAMTVVVGLVLAGLFLAWRKAPQGQGTLASIKVVELVKLEDAEKTLDAALDGTWALRSVNSAGGSRYWAILVRTFNSFSRIRVVHYRDVAAANAEFERPGCGTLFTTVPSEDGGVWAFLEE
jgi:hypothetical protein